MRQRRPDQPRHDRPGGPQSLYATYGSKRDPFLSAIRRYAENSEAEWERLLASGDSHLAGLQALFDRWATCPTELEGRGCPMVASINAVGARDEAFAAFACAHLERERAKLEAAIRRAQELDELDPGADPAAVASQLLAQVLGLATFAQLDGSASQVGGAAAGALATLERYAAGR